VSGPTPHQVHLIKESANLSRPKRERARGGGQGGEKGEVNRIYKKRSRRRSGSRKLKNSRRVFEMRKGYLQHTRRLRKHRGGRKRFAERGYNTFVCFSGGNGSPNDDKTKGTSQDPASKGVRERFSEVKAKRDGEGDRKC